MFRMFRNFQVLNCSIGRILIRKSWATSLKGRFKCPFELQDLIQNRIQNPVQKIKHRRSSTAPDKKLSFGQHFSMEGSIRRTTYNLIVKNTGTVWTLVLVVWFWIESREAWKSYGRIGLSSFDRRSSAVDSRATFSFTTISIALVLLASTNNEMNFNISCSRLC